MFFLRSLSLSFLLLIPLMGLEGLEAAGRGFSVQRYATGSVFAHDIDIAYCVPMKEKIYFFDL